MEWVSALSANDVWAVGFYTGSDGIIHGLTEHWDGTRWSVVPAVDATPYATIFYGVDAISSNDVWAVGYQQEPDLVFQPLAEHWDGAQWSVVPITPLPSFNNFLYGVSGAGSEDVWAVGEYEGHNDNGVP